MKVPTTRLLLVTEIWDGKPSHRKSLARNVYVLTYFLHLNNYLVIFLHNTIYRAQLFYPFLLSASEFLSNLLFSYHLLYFCTALFLIIILSSNHLHKSKTLSQLTQCPFTGTLLLLKSFPLPKNGGHFEFSNFCQKWQNTNFLLSP